MSSTDIHEPIPLSKWVTGTLTVHFAGATVERRVSLADALTVNQMVDDKRSSDHLTWSALNWFQFASEEVLACEFTVDEDLGYGLTSDERTTLTKHGHPHGILHALVDYWQDKGREPSYSVLAVRQLTQFVLEGTTGDAFTRYIERFEGQDGSDLMQEAIARVNAERDAPSTHRPTESTTEPEAADHESASDAEAEVEPAVDQSAPPEQDTGDPDDADSPSPQDPDQ